MPIRWNVNMGGVPELLGRLADPASVQAGIREGAEAFTEELKDSYPPDANAHRPQAQYWSDKQRRGFFYHLNRGDITVPYQRTNFLADHWKVRQSGQNFTAINDAPKASLVQGRFRTQYHKITGWKNPKELWATVRDKIGKVIRRTMLAHWLSGGKFLR